MRRTDAPSRAPAPLASLAAVVGVFAGIPLVAEDGATDPATPRTRAEILQHEREAKRESLVPYTVSRAERRVRFLETWRLPRRLFAKGVGGFRPLLGGLPSGSGLVAGAGYITGYNSETALFTADARFSTRGFRAFETNLLLWPRSRSLLPVEGRLTARSTDFGSVRHFGTGGDSLEEDRTDFRLERQSVEAGAEFRPGRFGSFGGDLRWLRAEASPATGRPWQFDPLEAPGFGARADFIVYGGHGELRLKERFQVPQAGVTLRARASRYLDQGSGRLSFTRLVGEAQAIVPLGYRNRALALRARTSHSVAGNGGAVPFYLMETLGGAQTIRGFQEFRFRDARNLVLNAEYRWEVWTYLDFVFFLDAGKVFSDAREMNFDRLRSGYGFGLRAHIPGGFEMRIDLAKSNEGLVLHTGSGPGF